MNFVLRDLIVGFGFLFAKWMYKKEKRDVSKARAGLLGGSSGELGALLLET